MSNLSIELVFLHLPHPFGRLVSVDEVADRHDEIGFDQIHVRDRFTQHRDACGGATRSITEDGEHERIVLQRQIEFRTPVRMEPAVIIDYPVWFRIRRVLDAAEDGSGDEQKHDGVDDAHGRIAQRWKGKIKSSTRLSLRRRRHGHIRLEFSPVFRPSTTHSFIESRFAVGDPAAWIEFTRADYIRDTLLIVRDIIELDRACRQARADAMAWPGGLCPEGGLSGDRETATGQALAECLRRNSVTSVVCDRSLPMSFAHEITQAGIGLDHDPDSETADRRAKDEAELTACVKHRRTPRLQCRWPAHSSRQGHCRCRRRTAAGRCGPNLGTGSTRHRCVPAGPQLRQSRAASSPVDRNADCHEHGSGPLRTGETVIIDIFPQSEDLYNGDCTCTRRVHGDIPDAAATIHAIVQEAKAKATAAVRAGGRRSRASGDH